MADLEAPAETRGELVVATTIAPPTPAPRPSVFAGCCLKNELFGNVVPNRAAFIESSEAVPARALKPHVLEPMLRKLVDGLSQHLSNAEAQLAGCAALRRLCRASVGSSTEPVSAELAKCWAPKGKPGVADSLLAALAAHPQEWELQEVCWSCLATLVSSSSVLEAAAVRGGALSGVTATLSAILDAPEAAQPPLKVQLAVAAAAVNLLGNAESQEKALAEGLVPQLVRGILSLSAQPLSHSELELTKLERQQSAQCTLRDRTLQESLAMQGGASGPAASARVVGEAMGERERLLVLFLQALRNASVRVAGKPGVTAAGGIRATLAALRSPWRECPSVAAAALGGLWSLAAVRDNKLALYRQNGLETVAEALKCHPEAETVQESGLGAMASIAWCSLTVRERARSLGGLTLASEALQRWPSAGGKVHVRVAELEALLKDRASEAEAQVESFMPNL